MSARQELDAARPVIAHMELARGAENAKSDLIRVWSAVEAALRSLVGGSTAGGQILIRDARSRQLLTFDQANALVSFLAVREQLDWPGYAPTESDLNVARSAFLKLDAGLIAPPAPAGGSPVSPYAPGGSTPVSPYAPGAPAASTAYATQTASNAAGAGQPIVAPAPGVQPLMRSRRRIWIPVVAILVIAALAIGGYQMFRGGGNDTLAKGIAAYQSGDRLTAANNFEQAARANPTMALPHVYLSRMAREVGNFTVANQELQLALKAEPQNLEGRREYGSLFLAQGNYENARVWYTHALEVKPDDNASQGWLGCSLIKLGRVDEGMRWLSRAGSGAWSACRAAAQAPLTAPGPIRP
jgi:tetratricopeptide (TPR) repeat protein